MEPILAWLFLSVVIERGIEILSKLFPVIDTINIKEFNIKMAIALLIGGVFAYGGQLDFFSMVSINFNIPYVGYAISALFLAAGSNYISDIIDVLNRSKEQGIIVVEVER